MPNTSEASGRATAAGDDNTDALEGVYDSLRSGEATGEEAVAATIHALTELVRAAVPVALSQPTRFVDLSFELVQQTINFERRVIFEVLYGLQRVMTEALADFESEDSFKGQRANGSAQRSRTARRAA
jgi:hypothetical protein